MPRTEVTTELRRIQEANGGLLRANDVVLEASREDSPLHPYFNWDDGAAAHQWRLQQARQLIRVCVEVLPYDEPHHLVRAYVSLIPDRVQDLGGYRSMVEVMSSPNGRHQLLQDALEQLARIRARYAQLVELAGVFRSISRAEREYGSTPPPPPPKDSDNGGDHPPV
jgi:hypothetical protein